MTQFSGIIVATITPFREGQVYKEGFDQLIDFLTARSVNGIFVCGTTGEGMIMNVKQRKRAAEVVVEKSRIPVIIHSGTNNLEETIELTRHAKDVGARAVATVTPMFYPYPNEGLANYFSAIAKSCDIPMFIYSNPGRTGVKLAPEVIARLFKTHPDSFAGVKESSSDMTYLGRVINSVEGKPVFNGADTCFLPGLVLGTAGQVSGYSTLVPELYVELFRAWVRGDLKSAQGLQSKISRIKLLLETPYIQPIKEGLKMRSIDVGEVRPPLVSMNKTEIDALGKSLNEIAPEIFSSEKLVSLA